MQKKIIQHCRNPINNRGMHKDAFDIGCHHGQGVDCFPAHHVVESCQHGDVLVRRLSLLTLAPCRHVGPRPVRPLLLLFLQLGHERQPFVEQVNGVVDEQVDKLKESWRRCRFHL